MRRKISYILHGAVGTPGFATSKNYIQQTRHGPIMSSTQTVPPNTVTKKNRQPSPAETARQERHSRRDTSRLVALERETARKETRAAKRELEKIRQESAKLETHVTQLRAALSKNCPSSNLSLIHI